MRPVGAGQVLARGLRGRCPVCGGRGVFQGWFRMRDDCPTCGLHFERIEGHWLGAVGMNTIVTGVVLLAFLVVGFALTWPEVAVAPMMVVGGALAVVVPLAFFPASRTLWTAIDLLMRPLRPGEARLTGDEQEPPDARTLRSGG